MDATDPTRDDDGRRGLLVPLCVGAIGVATLLLHLAHLTTEVGEVAPLLVGVVPPMGLSLALVAGGYWLRRSDVDETSHPRVLLWVVGGVAVVGTVGLSMVVYQTAHGARQVDVPFMAGNWVTTGALAGFLIGAYDARRRAALASLRQKHAALVAREAALERENERLDRFASILSHDLRNPLNVAQGRLELIREGGDYGEPDHLDAVARALDRMETIIADVLTMVRDGETVAEAELEAVDLGECAEAGWRLVDTGDATLQVAEHVSVRADRSRLCEVFENLFRNAVEHGADEDGRVAVTVGALPDGFYVADDGPGVPPGERDDVFEAGYSTAPDGTGYGLHIVQQIADAHGWDVRATDSESGGARFEVTGVDVDEP